MKTDIQKSLKQEKGKKLKIKFKDHSPQGSSLKKPQKGNKKFREQVEDENISDDDISDEFEHDGDSHLLESDSDN